MKYLYAVRDVKAGDIGDQVMVCKADAVAIRAFTDALKNPQNFMAKYPEDYELLCLGLLEEDGVIQNAVSGHDSSRQWPCVVLEGKAWKLSQEANS